MDVTSRETSAGKCDNVLDKNRQSCSDMDITEPLENVENGDQAQGDPEFVSIDKEASTDEPPSLINKSPENLNTDCLALDTASVENNNEGCNQNQEEPPELGVEGSSALTSVGNNNEELPEIQEQPPDLGVEGPTSVGNNNEELNEIQEPPPALAVEENAAEPTVNEGGVDEDEVIIVDAEDTDSQVSASKSSKAAKGPLPELVPIESQANISPIRTPRQAALKSAERIKDLTRLEKLSMDDYGLNTAPKGAGKNETTVVVQEISDPFIESCRQCEKFESCMFQVIGNNPAQPELKFCSKRCVKSHFKSRAVRYLEPVDNGERNGEGGATGHDFIIEPDIEIHTFSEDYQVECDDNDLASNAVEADNLNSNGSNVNTIEKVLEVAIRESLRCEGCLKPLLNLIDGFSWESMEFCSEKCLRTHMRAVGSHCNSCNAKVTDQILGKLCVRFGTVIRQFCSSQCLDRFKLKHKLCGHCQVNMLNKEQSFCSKTCEDLYLRLKSNKSKQLGQHFCAVCNQFKYSVEEVVRDGMSNWLCSKPCQRSFRFANRMTTLSCGTCTRSFDLSAKPRYVVRKSEVTCANLKSLEDNLVWFCSPTCHATHLLLNRQIEFCVRCQVQKYNVDMIRKVYKADNSKKSFFCSSHCYFTHFMGSAEARKLKASAEAQARLQLQPVANVQLRQQQQQQQTVSNPGMRMVSVPLSPPKPQANSLLRMPTTNANNVAKSSGDGFTTFPIELQHKIIFVPPKPVEMKNKSTMCRLEQGTQSDPAATNLMPKRDCTEKDGDRWPMIIPIPIPIPIYVPVPMMMSSFPIPMPLPVPVPTPMLLPVEARFIEDIVKTLKESSQEAQLDPLREEIEILNEQLGSANQEKEHDMIVVGDEADSSSEFLDAVGVLSNIEMDPLPEEGEDVDLERSIPFASVYIANQTSRKRCLSSSTTSGPKRFKEGAATRRSSDGEELNVVTPASPALTVEGTFQRELGQRAWTRWIKLKEGVKYDSSLKLSKMSIGEINTNLIGFVKDIRKPNGDAYRPDVLLYFLYGLQMDYGEQERSENLFMDAALLPFQLELDTKLQPYYDMLVKSITEEKSIALATGLKESHMWQCRQLGATSPIVLVFTMLYFNTKYFRLYRAEQHEKLSFSSVQKVIKKAPIHPIGLTNGSSSSSTLKAATKISSLQLTQLQDFSSNFKVIKPMEQSQNTENPLKCPVKHFSFYLSKCPESMRTKSDAFYLIPEATSTPDSPVWYSTQSVPQEVLARMLRRVLLIEDVLNNLCA